MLILPGPARELHPGALLRITRIAQGRFKFKVEGFFGNDVLQIDFREMKMYSESGMVHRWGRCTQLMRVEALRAWPSTTPEGTRGLRTAIRTRIGMAEIAIIGSDLVLVSSQNVVCARRYAERQWVCFRQHPATKMCCTRQHLAERVVNVLL